MEAFSRMISSARRSSNGCSKKRGSSTVAEAEAEAVVEEEAAAAAAAAVVAVATGAPPQVIAPFMSPFNPFTWFGSIEKAAVNETRLRQIEDDMFKRAVLTPHERFYVQLPEDTGHIWTLRVNPSSDNAATLPIVLVHGFGAGIGIWLNNVDALASRRPLYAFDVLGFGRSSRPDFSREPAQLEAQLVDSIEAWRKALAIDKFVLLGHSLGGYIATSYALKYPQPVVALLLADPWGFPDHEEAKKYAEFPMWLHMVERLVRFVNPMSVFRATGAYGIDMFKKLRPDFANRFSDVLDKPDIFYEYIYYSNSFKPSGEEALKTLIARFGYAKRPMIKRIHELDERMPVWFIFGARSWISSSNGHKAATLRPSSSTTDVKVIDGAGHHVYADRRNEFNDYVLSLLDLIDISYKK